MLPLIYHLQKVFFECDGCHSYFVIAQHPDHAREVLAHYLAELNYSDHPIVECAREYSSVQFIATLVNNENICACVLEL